MTYLENFFTLIFGVHRHLASGDVPRPPQPLPAAPHPPSVDGGLYLAVSPLHSP
nr:MAG TPA: hypothetical protein [Caudoviricetes sp.]